MNGKALFAAALLLGGPLAITAPASAQQAEDDIFKKLINVPHPNAYRVDGLRDKPKPRSDQNVQGGKALRVDVPGKAANAWAVSVAVPVNKPVKAGDKLVLAIWARLERGENGATSTTLPYNAVQMSKAPYTALFTGPLTIGPNGSCRRSRARPMRIIPPTPSTSPSISPPPSRWSTSVRSSCSTWDSKGAATGRLIFAGCRV